MAKTSQRKTSQPAGGSPAAPIVAEGSPKKFRARVRMYRQGLGDCFLVTFPRKAKPPFHILIDCGALARDQKFMTGIVEHIRDSVRNGGQGKAKLDLVVATHQHKDHLSGFNQAREVFNRDFDFGAVWLAWTENLTDAQVKKIKETKIRTASRLRAALDSPLAAASSAVLDNVRRILAFSEDDDSTGAGRVSDALDYLKLRGKEAGDLQFLKPGGGPLKLNGVPGVNVYVLGPPLDPVFLKQSAVTGKMKREDVVYHLTQRSDAAFDALSAAFAQPGDASAAGERYFPFSVEHRIPRNSCYFTDIVDFVAEQYDGAGVKWRRIDEDWMSAVGELALALDGDTNNTSLVLAFEFADTGEVLLFVGDAQVGNWQSWEKVSFQRPGGQELAARELLKRTVFYKVGHHCSHNATLKVGGLELMERDDLVAFIPLDRDTAKAQQWDMPAAPLYRALEEKAGRRVVISDTEPPKAAVQAGVRHTDAYIDYFVR